MKKGKSKKWFDPEVENTGWDKDMDAGTRRALMLKAHGGDVLDSGKAMQMLADVSQDKETMKAALQDAKYFYSVNAGKRKLTPLYQGSI
jgi:hypothetical protein